MSRFGIGQPVRRVEDQRFLTGRARYVDDIQLPRMMGNKEATDAAFARAKHTVSVRLCNNRITANTLEPRAVIGDYNAAVPAKTNPLGVKGVGEAGCVGAPPAVMNAILDPLRPIGVEHLDMPATPQRVWQAIRAAG